MWLEIVLLIIGIICVAASYIFFVKSDEDSANTIDVSLSDKQKEDIKAQISQAFEDTMEETKNACVDKTEVELDKLSNKKIQELAEYSETVLSEINRNHSEVMFLYDMLNEKNKEVHNNIRDISLASMKLADENALLEAAATQSDSKENTTIQKNNKKNTSESSDKKNSAKKTTASDKADVKKKTSAKQTASKAKKVNTDDYLAELAAASMDEQDDKTDNISVNIGGNKKEVILSLYREGKSNVEIAKTLGLGVGEVKLVIDLFKGKK